jgi:hypothetical protein
MKIRLHGHWKLRGGRGDFRTDNLAIEKSAEYFLLESTSSAVTYHERGSHPAVFQPLSEKLEIPLIRPYLLDLGTIASFLFESISRYIVLSAAPFPIDEAIPALLNHILACWPLRRSNDLVTQPMEDTLDGGLNKTH